MNKLISSKFPPGNGLFLRLNGGNIKEIFGFAKFNNLKSLRKKNPAVLRTSKACGKKFQGFHGRKKLAEKNFRDFTDVKSLREKISGISRT
ncbi:MAG: hypothetical protein LBD21_07590 [Tannerellaceae bacterium]|jgi:hypothetical protein|nr:hypothetical protein [Tannerellaceae bacterium]